MLLSKKFSLQASEGLQTSYLVPCVSIPNAKLTGSWTQLYIFCPFVIDKYFLKLSSE